jgi:predicted HicB family RNase H-like nuclease
MAEEKKTKVVTVRITESVHRALEAQAKAERRKLAALVALILEDHVTGKRAISGKGRARPT